MGSGYKLWGRKLGFSYSFLTPRRSKTTPGPGIIGNWKTLSLEIWPRVFPGPKMVMNGVKIGRILMILAPFDAKFCDLPPGTDSGPIRAPPNCEIFGWGGAPPPNFAIFVEGEGGGPPPSPKKFRNFGGPGLAQNQLPGLDHKIWRRMVPRSSKSDQF